MNKLQETHTHPVGQISVANKRSVGELMPSLWSIAAQLTSNGMFLLLQRPPAPSDFE